MVKQRIGRARVRSNPACIFIAEEECTLVLFVPSMKLDGDGSSNDNPEVVVSVDVAPAIPYGDENAATLPFDRAFPVYLGEGQQLWAISPGESEVTFSILPVPLSTLGY